MQVVLLCDQKSRIEFRVRVRISRAVRIGSKNT